MQTSSRRPAALSPVTPLLFGLISLAGCSDDAPTDALLGLQIRPEAPTVAVGEQLDLQAFGVVETGTGAELTRSATWSSADPTVAESLGRGAFLAKTVGQVEVTAEFGAVSASTTIEVTPAPPDRLEVTPEDPTLMVGGQVNLQATGWRGAESEDLTNAVTWSAVDLGVATVAGGAVTGLGAGETQVRATLGALTAEVTVTVSAAAVASLDLGPTPVELLVGETLSLEATATLTDGSEVDRTSDVDWSSEDAAIARVSDAGASKGLVTAVALGEATIVATDPGTEVRAEVTIRVVEPALVRLVVTPRTATIAAGEEALFGATATYSDGSERDVTGDVQWRSSDPTVALALPSGGRVRGLAAGAVTIDVDDAESGMSSADDAGSASVTVTPPALRGLQIQPPTATVVAGETQAFAAIGQFSDGTSQTLTAVVTWRSSNPAAATIDAAGLASGLAAGRTTIAATDPVSGIDSGPAGSALLTVDPPDLVSIAVSPPTFTLAEQNQRSVTATGLFSDGSTQDLTSAVTWSSSAPAATVDAAGAVTAVTPGTATINALHPPTGVRSSDTNQSAVVTVIPRVIVSIAVTPNPVRLPVGAQVSFIGAATYNDQSVADVTSSLQWQSSSSTIAAIGTTGDDVGVAEAAGPGRVTVSASDPASGVSSDDSAGSATMTVSATVTLVSLAVTSPTSSLVPGATARLDALGTFSDGNVYSMRNRVTWSSSAPTVASVSNAPGQQGRLTAAAPGTTVVSAVYAPTGTSSGPGPTITVLVPNPTLTAGANTTQHGNLSGGSPFNDACPAGQALIGVDAQVSGWLNKIGGRCGTLSVQAGSGGFSIVVTPGATLPLRGLAAGTPGAAVCPANEVVIGFAARTGGLVDQIALRCAPLTLTLTPQMTFAVGLGPISTPAPVGGNGGTARPIADCPGGQIGTVARIRAGNSVDAFGLGCSTVTVP